MATAEDWATLLRPLLVALNNKPTQQDFMARASVIAFALPDVPVSMLTGWRQRDVVRAFKFLPSPAEVEEWLGDALKTERRLAKPDQRALPAPAPEARGPRTVEEILAVRQTVQAFMAERNKAPGSADMPPVQPRYLTDTQLIAALERDIAVGGPGVEACKMRLRVLKARQQEARA
jgi:hypothetical protein